MHFTPMNVCPALVDRRSELLFQLPLSNVWLPWLFVDVGLAFNALWYTVIDPDVRLSSLR